MHIWTIHIVSPVCGSFPFTIDRNSRSVLSWIFDVLIQMIVSPKHDTTLATGHICPPRWGGKLYNNLYQTVSSTWCGKKKCGNKPALFNTKKDGLLGATTSLSIYFLQKYLYNTTKTHDAAGSTRCNLGPHALGLSRLAQGRVCCVSWCILAAKSGTVLVRKPQVKTICNHTKSIYEYYSCSAVSTIATLGYSLYICIWQFIKPLQLSIWYTIIVFRYC